MFNEKIDALAKSPKFIFNYTIINQINTQSVIIGYSQQDSFTPYLELYARALKALRVIPTQAAFLDCKGKIQGVFGERSGNARGMLGERSGSARGTLGERSGNARGTLGERSGNTRGYSMKAR